MGVPVLPYVKQLKKESALRSNYKKAKNSFLSESCLARKKGGEEGHSLVFQFLSISK